MCETEGCDTRFRGHTRHCGACRTRERACTDCGKVFRSMSLRCWACRAPERDCAECGRRFRGQRRCCSICIASERACDQCGETFRGKGRYCQPCLEHDRECETCGKQFKGKSRNCNACIRKAGDADEWANRNRQSHNKRRARKYKAQIAGPVPAEVYAAIRASGPCVYCGKSASTVDHVVPLVRGGAEHEDNLVPACGGRCNQSKGTKFLTEWRHRDRVAHAVEVSTKVAAAYRRELAALDVAA